MTNILIVVDNDTLLIPFQQQEDLVVALQKAQIVDSVSKKAPMSKTKAIDTVEKLLEIMKRTMENGEDVLISGFGKFCVREKKERRGRNTETGNDMILEARRVVTFRCSETLKEKLNIKKKKRKKRK